METNIQIKQIEQKEQIKLIHATDFVTDEINEVSKYVIANVPYTVLQQMFPLTEEIENKSKIFTIVYRIINSVKGYVSKDETRNKIGDLLNSCKEEYLKIYELLIDINSGSEYLKSRTLDKIKLIYLDFDKNVKINNIIDVFLVFAEKHVLRDLRNITGIITDKPEGEKFVEELSKTLE